MKGARAPWSLKGKPCLWCPHRSKDVDAWMGNVSPACLGAPFSGEGGWALGHLGSPAPVPAGVPLLPLGSRENQQLLPHDPAEVSRFGGLGDDSANLPMCACVHTRACTRGSGTGRSGPEVDAPPPNQPSHMPVRPQLPGTAGLWPDRTEGMASCPSPRAISGWMAARS